MIIFDLDGTLADCDHRRHYIDARRSLEGIIQGKRFKPDWKGFFEACDKDNVIQPVADAFIHLTQGEPFNHDVRIWSGRCESVREKTLKLLMNLYGTLEDYQYWDRRLKMRPIGDNTPDDVLKERWLDEAISEGKQIEFVFDDRPKVVRMWRRRGIFVFDCNQTGEEF